MMQRLAKLLCLGLLPGLLSGCMAGFNYAKPELPAGPNWVEADGLAMAQEGSDQPWWLVLGDPRLNALMDKAVAGNLDVQVALARIKEAQAARSGAVAQLLPTSSGELTVARTNPGSGYHFDDQSQLQAGFNASWEIDLLGGNRRELEARTAERQAAYLNRDAVLLGMTVEVARNYVQLRDAGARIRVLQENVATQGEMLRLTTERHKYGIASALEVAQAARQVSATRAELHPLMSSQAQAKHRLELLLGLLPGELTGLDDLSEEITPPQGKLVLASPGAVLVRRPDVALAERQLAAAVARQGVTRAAWLPRFSLSAMLGAMSVYPENMLYPSGNSFNVGGSVTQPLLDFGRIAAQIRVSDARAEAALASLKRTALAGLSEVETALAVYVNNERRRVDLADTEAKAAEALRLSRQLYLDGLGQFLNVLDAQRVLLVAQMARAEADAQAVRAVVDLEAAMGGTTYPNKPEPSPVNPPLFKISLPPKASN